MWHSGHCVMREKRERKTKINKSRSWHEMDGTVVHAKLAVICASCYRHTLKSRTALNTQTKRSKNLNFLWEWQLLPQFLPLQSWGPCTHIYVTVHKSSGCPVSISAFCHDPVVAPLLKPALFAWYFSIKGGGGLLGVSGENTVTQSFWFFGHQQQVLAGCSYS